MAENKTNTGLWIGAGALALATGIFFYFKNKTKKETADENKAISDLSTNEDTELAALLKKYLNVSDTVLVGWKAGDPQWNDAQSVLNTCLRITDFNGVATKFSALCNNAYTLIKALQDGLSNERYTKALQYAKAQKAVTVKPYRSGQTFPANTIMGAVIGEGANAISGAKTYKVINSYEANRFTADKENVFDIPQEFVRLV